MKVLVTGATGLIGRSLCASLSDHANTVIGVSRSPETARGVAAAELQKWDPQSGQLPVQALSEVDAVVHLAGEPIVANRWTEDQKKRIRDSRVLTTRALVEAFHKLEAKPVVFICGSAVGFYGDRGDEPLEETSSPGDAFLSDVCGEWESEAAHASVLGIRVVQVRTGVVLSTGGGALPKILAPFKLGLGGRLGSGKQWFPWIHIDDIVGIFRHALNTVSLTGPVNGVAPGAATNAEFTRELAKALHRPAFLPVPEFALRALMGEMADALLASQHVVPKAATDSRYEFRYPTLAPALKSLLG